MGEYEYKKITKNDINLPQYCLYFIEVIQNELNKTDFDEYEELVLTVETSRYPYCYDAFELITRTFERKGYWMQIPTFKTEKDDDGKKTYRYKFNIKEITYKNDLPF